MTLPASVPAALSYLPRFAACAMKQLGVTSTVQGGGKRRAGMIHIITRTAVNRPTNVVFWMDCNVVFWMDCLVPALFGLRAGHHAETQRRARPARVLD